MTAASKYTTKTSTAKINGYDTSYAYDSIENRNATGQVTGNPAVTTAYTTNGLNQYTAISNPQISPVRGIAPAATSVSIDGISPLRQVSGFYTQGRNESTKLENLSLLLGATPWSTGAGYVPPAAETLVYDLDGNLTADGRGNYSWDAENRLVGFTSTYGAGLYPQIYASYKYDARGRRIQKSVTTVVSAAVTKVVVERFAWHGWQMTRKVTSADTYTGGGIFAAHSHQDYTWGLDVSNTLEGAGCVGGLAMVTAPLSVALNYVDGYGNVLPPDPYINPDPTTTAYDTWFPTYDHNGNVNHLVRQPTFSSTATTDTYGNPILDPYGNPAPVTITYTPRVDATYEYDAFGNILRATGPATAWNNFTFSTKYLDQETGWSYYGYRYYDALRGRWTSRDPIEENGGVNLYSMVQNNPIGAVDLLGQSAWDCVKCGVGIGLATASMAGTAVAVGVCVSAIVAGGAATVVTIGAAGAVTVPAVLVTCGAAVAGVWATIAALESAIEDCEKCCGNGESDKMQREIDSLKKTVEEIKQKTGL